jgi:hypothetical protein
MLVITLGVHMQLNAGQPITVVGIGSSITASFGGCFYDGSFQQLKDKVWAVCRVR